MAVDLEQRCAHAMSSLERHREERVVLEATILTLRQELASARSDLEQVTLLEHELLFHGDRAEMLEHARLGPLRFPVGVDGPCFCCETVCRHISLNIWISLHKRQT